MTLMKLQRKIKQCKLALNKSTVRFKKGLARNSRIVKLFIARMALSLYYYRDVDGVGVLLCLCDSEARVPTVHTSLKEGPH
jgi:hypothetical protein